MAVNSYEMIKALSELKEVVPGTNIYEWRNALSRDVCNQMIDMFEAHDEEQATGKVAKGIYWPELKRSTDVYLRGQEHWEWADQIFVQSMREAVGHLANQHPVFREDVLEDQGYQIQRTLPGEYYHWHKDLNQHCRRRVLVLIWYLNDVPEEAGGATEFLKQNIKIQPEAGKLLLFPPYWTHVHRGCELLEGVKYLATTWIAYVGANDDDEGVEYSDQVTT